MEKSGLSLSKMTVPLIVMTAFWGLAVVLWQASGYIQPLIMFGYIGTSIGLGLGLYAALPRKRKPVGRRLALILVGSGLFGGVAVLGGENMQLEGFFFALLGGVFQAALMHYLIAKIVGPLLFGRLWCGWACWTVMVLDLLPFQRTPGRLPERWGWLRYIHFFASLALALGLWYGIGFKNGAVGNTAVIWFVAGNLLYYALGIGLAYRLKDNRAFCKYICPVTLPLKLISRFALLKVGGSAGQCTGCQACTQACPMDIRVSDYTRAGRRVLSTECTLCQTCISACPQEALKLSVGFDLGGEEKLRYIKP